MRVPPPDAAADWCRARRHTLRGVLADTFRAVAHGAEGRDEGGAAAFRTHYGGLADAVEARAHALDGYERIGVLARGAHSVVCLAVPAPDAADARNARPFVALKSVPKADTAGTDAALVEREIASHSTTWLLPLLEAFHDARRVHYVFELMPGGCVADVPYQPEYARAEAGDADGVRLLAEDDAAFYAAELLAALAELHGLGYAHCDVKPGCVLVARDGHVRLGGLGSARRLCRDGSFLADAARLPGTPDYVAPEAAAAIGAPRPVRLTSAVDVWAAGAVLFELLVGEPPFLADFDAHTLHRVLHAETSLDLRRARLSAAARDLLQRMLAPAETRVSAAQALRHVFFARAPRVPSRRSRPPYVPSLPGDWRDYPLDPLPLDEGPPDERRPALAEASAHLSFVGITWRRDDVGPVSPITEPETSGEVFPGREEPLPSGGPTVGAPSPVATPETAQTAVQLVPDHADTKKDDAPDSQKDNPAARPQAQGNRRADHGRADQGRAESVAACSSSAVSTPTRGSTADLSDSTSSAGAVSLAAPSVALVLDDSLRKANLPFKRTVSAAAADSAPSTFPASLALSPRLAPAPTNHSPAAVPTPLDANVFDLQRIEDNYSLLLAQYRERDAHAAHLAAKTADQDAELRRLRAENASLAASVAALAEQSEFDKRHVESLIAKIEEILLPGMPKPRTRTHAGGLSTARASSAASVVQAASVDAMHTARSTDAHGEKTHESSLPPASQSDAPAHESASCAVSEAAVRSDARSSHSRSASLSALSTSSGRAPTVAARRIAQTPVSLPLHVGSLRVPQDGSGPSAWGATAGPLSGAPTWRKAAFELRESVFASRDADVKVSVACEAFWVQPVGPLELVGGSPVPAGLCFRVRYLHVLPAATAAAVERRLAEIAKDDEPLAPADQAALLEAELDRELKLRAGAMHMLDAAASYLRGDPGAPDAVARRAQAVVAHAQLAFHVAASDRKVEALRAALAGLSCPGAGALPAQTLRALTRDPSGHALAPAGAYHPMRACAVCAGDALPTDFCECAACGLHVHRECRGLLTVSCAEALALRDVAPRYFMAASPADARHWVRVLDAARRAVVTAAFHSRRLAA